MPAERMPPAQSAIPRSLGPDGAAAVGGEVGDRMAVAGGDPDPVATGHAFAGCAAAGAEPTVHAALRPSPAAPEAPAVEPGAAADDPADQALGEPASGSLAHPVGRRLGRFAAPGAFSFASSAARRRAAGAGEVLAGDAVVVAVEVVRVAREEVFLGFGLVGEVGAVVVEGAGAGRRQGVGCQRAGAGDEGQGKDEAQFHLSSVIGGCIAETVRTNLERPANRDVGPTACARVRVGLWSRLAAS